MVTVIEKAISFLHSQVVLEEAANLLKKGGLVAFPTETVYGLGANAYNIEAVKKIFAAKGRPPDNPLIIHINSFNMVFDICENVPELAKALAESFWPGPLTLVMKKSEKVPYEVTAGLDSVGVRLPNHKTALALIEKCGFPIAAPSANASGRPSPTRASHVAYDLSGKIDMIVDGGPCEIGLESTVVDITGNMPVVLRPGSISQEDINEAVKAFIARKGSEKHIETPVEIHERGFTEQEEIPKSPGMKYRHYSPKAEITIIRGSADNVAKKINQLVSEAEKAGEKAGVLVTDEVRHLFKEGHVISVGSLDNMEEIAGGLFKALRKFDFYEINKVYSVSFPETGIGTAVMNRLVRASGREILDV